MNDPWEVDNKATDEWEVDNEWEVEPEVEPQSDKSAFGAGVDAAQEIAYRALKGTKQVVGTGDPSGWGAVANNHSEEKDNRTNEEKTSDTIAVIDERIAENEQDAHFEFDQQSYKDIDSIGSLATYTGQRIANSLPQMALAANPYGAATMAAGLSEKAYDSQEEGEKNVTRAVASGTGQILLERLGFKGSFGQLGKDILKDGVIATSKKYAKGEIVEAVKNPHVARRLMQGMAWEGATEAGQDALAMWGAGKDFSEFDIIAAKNNRGDILGEDGQQLMESFVAGAVVGGSIRSASETAQYVINWQGKAKEITKGSVEKLMEQGVTREDALMQVRDQIFESAKKQGVDDVAAAASADKTMFDNYGVESELFTPIANDLMTEREAWIAKRDQLMAENRQQTELKRQGIQERDLQDTLGGETAPTVDDLLDSAAKDNAQPDQFGIEHGQIDNAESNQVLEPVNPAIEPINSANIEHGPIENTDVESNIKEVESEALNDNITPAESSPIPIDETEQEQQTTASQEAVVASEAIEKQSTDNVDKLPSETFHERLGLVKTIEETDQIGAEILKAEKDGLLTESESIKLDNAYVLTKKKLGFTPDWMKDSNTNIDKSANEAATSPTNDLPEPSQAQKDAGNYKMGRIEHSGFKIGIENPQGSTRSGKDKDGQDWSVTMKSHYGDITGTKGADGDAIDVFIKPSTEQSDKVFIVDQINPSDGTFDEHKVMMGFDSKEEAQAAYQENYAKDWQGIGNITESPINEFKEWVKSGETTKPFKSKIKESVEINTSAIDNYNGDKKNLRKLIAESARQKFTDNPDKGTFVTIKDTNEVVKINWQGIKHTANTALTEKSAMVMTKLDKLLENAKHISTEPDKKNRPQIKAIHAYSVDVKLNDENVKFKVVVRESNEGKLFYDHSEMVEPQHGNLLGIDNNQSDQTSYQGSKEIVAPKNEENKIKVPAQKSKPVDKIDDFGEVLHGAAKHNYTLKENLSNEIDVSAEPLSKSFPQPNYEKLSAEGVNAKTLAFIAQLRGEIKTKPRQQSKLINWSHQVSNVRHSASKLLEMGSNGPDILIDKLRKDKTSYNRYLEHMPHILDIATEIPASSIKALGSYKLSQAHYSMYRDERNVNKWVVTNTDKKSGFGGMGNMQHFDKLEDATAYIKGQVTDETITNGKPQAKFDTWRERGNKNIVFIGKKVSTRKYIELHQVSTYAEAREYIKDNNESLVAELKEKKTIKAHRKADNNPRIGADHRNGKDVTPEMFDDAFGFRGVQFGNWVENHKRINDLNYAYDGLMDLAGILEVPPKALSLNGTLGLAFGARGKGGAMAHYEPSNIVINLTKKMGSGSLAHEWFHALDGYFANLDNLDSHSAKSAPFMTEHKRKPMINDAKKGVYRSSVPSDFNVREEVYTAFKSIKDAIEKETGMVERAARLDSYKAKDYWGTVREMSARSFERYVIDKLAKDGHESDYLANVVKESSLDASDKLSEYPYPLDIEMDAVNKAYDHLFDILETKETTNGVAFFSISAPSTVTSNSKTKAKGLSIAEVESITNEFLAEYNGNVELNFAIKNTQEELYGAESTADRVGTIKGAYHHGQVKRAGRDGVQGRGTRGFFTLAGQNLSSRADARETLRHEILGHYGLDTFKKSDKKDLLDKIIASKNEPKLKAQWDKIKADKHYKTLDEYGQAEEVFAHVIENRRNGFEKIYDQIISWLKQALRNVGLNKYPSSTSELHRLAETISKKIKSGEQGVAKSIVDSGAFYRAKLMLRSDDWPVIDEKEINNNPVLFSRTANSNSLPVNNNNRAPIGKAHVNRILTEIVARWSGDINSRLNEFIVVDSFDALPDAIKDAAQDQNAQDAVQGVSYHGKTYIVSDKMNSKKDVEKVIFHEAYGHYGIRKLFGKELESKLNKLLAGIGGVKGIDRVAAKYNVNLNDYKDGFKQSTLNNAQAQTVLMDELLAHLAQDNRPSIKRTVKEVVGLIRQSLKKLGLTSISGVSNSELFYILKQARLAVESNNQTNDINSDIRFSLTNDVENSSSFKGNIQDETKKDLFIRKVQDKFQRLNVVQRSLNTNENNDTYMAEEAYHGKASEDLRKLKVEYTDKIAELMADNDLSQDEVDLFLIAKHAEERNAYIDTINPDMNGEGSGMSNSQAQSILAKALAEEKHVALNEVASTVYSMLDKNRKMMVEFGLEPQDAIDTWQSQYKFYVPLKGYAKEDGTHSKDEKGKDSKPYKKGKGFNIKGRETIKAMGRRSLAESPLAHSIQDATQAIIRARKNEVGNTFLKLVNENPDPELWQVFTAENPDIGRGDVTKDGKTTIGPVKLSAMTMRSSDDYFKVKTDGVESYIKIHDAVLKNTMANLGVDEMGVLTRSIGKVTRALSALVTTWNPEFMVTNFTRDIQAAVANVLAETDVSDGKALDTKGLATEMVTSIPRAMAVLRHGVRKNSFDGSGKFSDPELGDYLKEFLESGAKTGWVNQKDVNELAKELKSSVGRSKNTKWGKAKRYAHNAAEFVKDWNDIIENATRFSVYHNARSQGVSIKQASSLAKNLTINFNRKGEMGAAVNAWYMFSNASVQGTANVLRAIATPKDRSKSMWNPEFYNLSQKLAISSIFVTWGMAQTMRELGGEDEDGVSYYDKIPDYIKATNFVITTGDGDYITIPMPYGYNFLAGIGHALDGLAQGQSLAKQGTKLTLSAVGTFSPLGLDESENSAISLTKMMSPTVASPIVEMAVDANFHGGNIYPDSRGFNTKKADANQVGRLSWDWTQGFTSWLNEATGGSEYRSGKVDISPQSIEHMAKFMGGGVLQFGLRWQNMASKAVNGQEIEKRDVPFTRRFFKTLSPKQTIGEFYDAKEDLDKYQADLKLMKGVERRKFQSKYENHLSLARYSTSINKELRALNKRKRNIEAGSLSQEDKVRKLARIEENKIDATMRFSKKRHELGLKQL